MLLSERSAAHCSTVETCVLAAAACAAGLEPTPPIANRLELASRRDMQKVVMRCETRSAGSRIFGSTCRWICRSTSACSAMSFSYLRSAEPSSAGRRQLSASSVEYHFLSTCASASNGQSATVRAAVGGPARVLL